MSRTYEHLNVDGTFQIAQVLDSVPARSSDDFLRDRRRWGGFLDGEQLVLRDTAEAALAALLANQLDARPQDKPRLDTRLSRLPKTLAEWRWVGRGA